MGSKLIYRMDRTSRVGIRARLLVSVGGLSFRSTQARPAANAAALVACRPRLVAVLAVSCGPIGLQIQPSDAPQKE